MDWKTKLFQILDCLTLNEGTWFETQWSSFGITDEDAARINDGYAHYDRTKNHPVKAYVAGFYFSHILSEHLVALVQKTKPEWQRGKLNAIGGKIEEGETPAEAMRREFKEETGVDVPEWEPTVTLKGEGWVVYFFRSFGDPTKCMTMEEEPIGVFNYLELPTNVIPNLKWLVPLNLDVNLKMPIVLEV